MDEWPLNYLGRYNLADGDKIQSDNLDLTLLEPKEYGTNGIVPDGVELAWFYS